MPKSVHETNKTMSYSYIYKCFFFTFSLGKTCFGVPICGNITSEPCPLVGAKSSAEFYVFVGVIVFLYCLAALVLYIVFDHLYRRNSRIVIAVSAWVYFAL